MTMILIIVLALGLVQDGVAVREFRTLDHLKPKSSSTVQTIAAQELIQRLIPTRAADFIVKVDPSIGPENKDTFNIIASKTKVNITGTTGVAVAMGFYYYISYYCECQVTWAGKQLNIPTILPVIQKPGVTITTNDRFRYYENVCTVSYSFAFYNWTDWENQIDWMALHGINMLLAFTGQEAVFQRVYRKMGLTTEELQNHFGGPGFLAWARMGNIHGWGGPLPQTWINDQLVLQHKILDRVRSLGMIPVLAGFAGHVPQNITRIYPTANVSRMNDWASFDHKFCCTYLLDFDDPLFIKIGAAVMREMLEEFGTDHIYNVDTFNEMKPRSGSTAYLNKAGSKVFEAMLEGDPKAIWLMQGWLFGDRFWTPARVKSLVNAVPQGRMIILDLASDNNPHYIWTDSYFGQPYIWCMIHNFGGTMEFYGHLDIINVRPIQARNRPHSTMIGVGLTPEGIYQNEMIYEFMIENAWQRKPRNINKWISNFVIRRYGKANSFADKAWQSLLPIFNDKVGNPDTSHNVIPTARPSLIPIVKQVVWYDPKDLYTAWSYILQAAKDFPNNKLFLYDLVDISRNSLQILSMKYYSDLTQAYFTKKTADVALSGMKLLQLIEDMDTLLASDEHFLFGKWLKSAKDLAKDEDEVALYEFNARNQITLWGPRGEITDYACKQWAGLVKGYYLPRWQLFVEILKESLYNNTNFNQNAFHALLFNKVEQPFQYNATDFPTTTTGNSVQISNQLYEKYKPEMQSEFFTKLYKQSLSHEANSENFMSRKYDGYHFNRRNSFDHDIDNKYKLLNVH